ncbi:MAG: cohesin domain-containing protein [Lachnospiraceae bacterium]
MMKRKILSVITSIALVVASICCSASAAVLPVLTVSSSAVVAGEKTTIELSVDKVSNLIAADLWVTFDSDKLEYVSSDVNGNITKLGYLNDTSTKTYTNENGCLKFAMAHSEGQTVKGEIINVTFKAKQGTSGKVDVRCVVHSFASAEGNIPYTVNYGTITIKGKSTDSNNSQDGSSTVTKPSDNNTTPAQATDKVFNVKPKSKKLKVGETVKLKATVKGYKGKVKFVSGNAKVAKVNKTTGKVTAKKVGKAVVKCKLGKKVREVTIRVIK